MNIFQMTGLSGAGKTTIAQNVKTKLIEKGYAIEVLDGDVFRKNLCPDLGFSKEHRCENVRRIGFVANILAQNKIIVLISAINPYDEIRQELAEKYQTKLIYVKCDVATLRNRDTKGLYERAFLPENHPDKLRNLTGVNDTFEIPENPDLIVDTSEETLEDSLKKVLDFILNT